VQYLGRILDNFYVCTVMYGRPNWTIADNQSRRHRTKTVTNNDIFEYHVSEFLYIAILYDVGELMRRQVTDAVTVA